MHHGSAQLSSVPRLWTRGAVTLDVPLKRHTSASEYESIIAATDEEHGVPGSEDVALDHKGVRQSSGFVAWFKV